ncbi:Cell cycle checkpoint protein RAD17 [Morella rubra]|uniref:Cell cycle checkpoint protein RAD17 n=1 Tax=Morella rubra TaxID=262757 RepID=A0A6A1UMT4_9ROSI|nr:Cell cycle checkpoint protein RAD17 [Morella rubra]
MGKRNNVVVLSSDGEDDDCSLSLNRSYSKPKSRSLVTRSNPRGPKKACLSGSRSHSSKESRNVVQASFFGEGFDQVFNGFKVPAGFRGSNAEGLWVDKYKRHSLEELAVHKKKVEEVKVWFEERFRSSKFIDGFRYYEKERQEVATRRGLRITITMLEVHYGALRYHLLNSQDELDNYVLVLTGQAGVGKSLPLLQVLAIILYFLMATKLPLLGINYTSKLDEFENFVERIRKYGLISSSFTGESKSSIILLIDDLPLTNGKAAFRKLQSCLHLLVRSTRIPTAILLTDYGKTDSADYTARCLEEIRLCLESAGACKVAFNPITNNSIKKTLSRICRQERCYVAAEQIDLIAKACGGDIRHAITSLQFFCLKPGPQQTVTLCNTTYSREKPDEACAMDGGFSLHFGKDETLSLLHALGKFLHNKRDTENAMALDQDEFLLRESLSRLPLKMDVPEKVMCQAHGQTRPIADFLHENVLDFLSEEAIDDARAVASYLGDADMLLATFGGMLARCNEAENILQLAAASVAVRGVLFGNSHPLPSRWHAIRRPKLWQIEQSSLVNKKEMVRHRFTASGGISLSNLSVVATEYTPVCKWLGNGTSEDLDIHQWLTQPNNEEDGFDKMRLDDKESETTDDEIEDW